MLQISKQQQAEREATVTQSSSQLEAHFEWREQKTANRSNVELGPTPDVSISTWEFGAFPPDGTSEDVLNHGGKLSPNVTVVTLFMNIGTFQKGEGADFFTPSHYYRWMRIFRWLMNPLVVYVETDRDYQAFMGLRSLLPHNNTVVVKLKRDQLWAFRDLLPRVKSIFETPGYPKHHPNTVVPEYSCIMHAKYELVYRTVVQNPFKTKYFSWLDIGLFRDITDHQASYFEIVLPPKFDKHRVAYTKVYEPTVLLAPKDIFFHNVVWVCGCYFVAEASVMLHWATEYKKYTEFFISQHIMNTDQQVLLAMQNAVHRPDVQIQTYKGDGRFNEWFHLGYISKVDIKLDR